MLIGRELANEGWPVSLAWRHSAPGVRSGFDELDPFVTHACMVVW
jgi:hypothetical protein